jgi:GNAT superfamily N-acetyltransferase
VRSLTDTSGAVHVRAREAADDAFVRATLHRSWGGTVVVSRGRPHDAFRLPGFVALGDGRPVGLLTYRREPAAVQIVTVNADPPGRGTGAALLASVLAVARAEGRPRIWLITTNDNVAAVRFYQRHGFRLVRVHLGAVDEARRQKPAIPEVSADGIALRDELEFVYDPAGQCPGGSPAG